MEVYDQRRIHGLLRKRQAVAVNNGEKSRGKQMDIGERGRQLHLLFVEVYRLQGCLATIKDQIHEQGGMDTPQRKVMKILEKEVMATVPIVALSLGISRQSVQKTVNTLIIKGYIRNTDNPMHKRSKLLELTESGQQALALARKNEARIIEQVLPDLDAGDASQAAVLLNKIREGIEGARPV